MNLKIEKRQLDGLAVSDANVVSGIAMPYSSRAQIGPNLYEEFRPGAFGNIDEMDVVLNSHHVDALPLARTGAGLSFMDSDSELRFEANIIDTSNGNDTYKLVKDNVLRGSSVEFLSEEEHQEGNVRVITRAKLIGLGLVLRPAYTEATIEARAKEETLRENKRCLLL